MRVHPLGPAVLIVAALASYPAGVDVRYIFTHRSDDPDRVEPDGILATVGVKFLF